MRCAAILDSGVLQVAADGAACSPESLVVLTQSEASAAFSSPLALSVEDAFQVGGSILLVWATAWAFRAVGSLLRDRDDLAESD